MNYYAITVNNKELTEKFKSIKQLYEHFSVMPVTVYTISCERNELNQNIHYHMLIGSKVPVECVESHYIWWKELQSDLDVMKYHDYIKKDGNYKVYNTITLDNQQDDTKYHQMLRAVQSYNKFGDMIRDNPHFIKDIHKLRLLWEVINNNI
ncbi:MAG: hypothetical protein QXI16_05200 [Sulfolobaceae archaeon]